MKTMLSTNRRKFFSSAAVLTAGTLAAPAVAKAETSLKWRMVTSWPANAPGSGLTANRLAKRINDMSNGELTVTVYAAGELVPPFEVLDAVGAGSAEMGHTAPLFWQGKMPVSALFTAAPFGLTPLEHHAWIFHGGGQQLWDRLYSPFKVKPFMGANSGLQMGGWFKKEINSLDDLKGLKMRIPGLGGAILEKLGGVPTSLPPGEIFTALQSGLIDGTEFLGPWADSNFGFQKVAPYYYFPGFHEPNGTGECLVNKEAYENLPKHLQHIIENACMAENSYALAETEWFNAEALQKLTSEDGVKLRHWPEDILKAARSAGEEVLDRVAATDALSGEIVASFRAARSRTSAWSKVGHRPFYAARDL